ncbi:class II glutamine amidotransferase, partial [Francisella tularensis subsp. holarctica]|nr:class II glutamine amidotransferase [Francisella tularensis subsp. holarctica]
MCRWLMYHGDKIKMSDLLVDPENSLIPQCIHSSQGAVPVNG